MVTPTARDKLDLRGAKQNMNLCRATVAAGPPGATTPVSSSRDRSLVRWPSTVVGEITHRPVASVQVGQRILQVGHFQLLDHALDQLGVADRRRSGQPAGRAWAAPTEHRTPGRRSHRYRRSFSHDHPPEARSGTRRTALTFIQATALTCRLLKVSRDYSSLYRMAAAIAPTLDQFFRGERCGTRVSRAPCGVWSAGLPSSVGRINPTGTE
jgi:hypothetical protein